MEKRLIQAGAVIASSTALAAGEEHRDVARRRAPLLLASLAGAMAVVAIAGWVIDHDALQRVFFGGRDMKFNTAIGILLLAAAVIQAATHAAPRALRAAAILVVLLGAATLVEYAFHVNLGIDELFIRDTEGTASTPGRMALTAAMNFTLLGSALLLVDVKKAAWRRAFHLMTAAVVTLSLISFLSSVVGGHARWAEPPFTAIVIPTVLAFLLLSTALLVGRAEEGWLAVITADTMGGQVFRRLILPTILIPPVLMMLRVAGEQHHLFDTAFGRSFIVGGTVITLAVMLLQTAYYMHCADLQRREAEHTLAAAYQVLYRQTQREGSEPHQHEQLQQTVETLAARLANANAELEAFTYSVSHDLRAPLRTLDGFSRELLDGYSSVVDERGRHYLTRIRAASQRMATLIDDMLRLSRIGKASMRSVDVNISGIAAEIAAELREAEPERAVEFDIKPGIVLHGGDPDLMRLALRNLIGNAWKFTARSAPARCDVQLVDGAEGRELVIRDNGAGFDMQYAGKLFTAFQRLHSTADFEGTGIGLAIVRRVLSRHGGTVRAEAAVGQGAAFFLKLPNLEIES